ncbi:MAG TPA: hypothetical protein VNR37_08655 [Microbacteriaceae bacterium]|nr:hypothetical protein [Microbacteriaceae bacterium]
MSAIRILEVFAGHFDQNGDSGNTLALGRRLEWSGFDVRIERVAAGEPWPGEAPDFVLVGGGSIPAQRDALPHLLAERDRLTDWVAAGVGYLAVAGGYALSARSVHLPGESAARDGLGLVTGRAVALDGLATGPLVVRSTRHGVLHGYVNLAQRVLIDDDATALGLVERGPWAAAAGEPEGTELGSVYGSHAHGPILPKNPVFADAFIRSGLRRRGLAEDYRHAAQHEHVDALARRARASLAQRLDQPPPD